MRASEPLIVDQIRQGYHNPLGRTRSRGLRVEKLAAVAAAREVCQCAKCYVSRQARWNAAAEAARRAAASAAARLSAAAASAAAAAAETRGSACAAFDARP